jgi:hypothetical protein
MNDKKAQYFGNDLQCVMPLQSLVMQLAPITNKEATTLYSIYQSDRDQSGNAILPDGTDDITVASLVSKGLLSGRVGIGIQSMQPVRTVGFTDKAIGIIRNIILVGEESAFSKSADREINYEAIHRAIIAGPRPKRASKKASVNHRRQPRNWLERLVCGCS